MKVSWFKITASVLGLAFTATLVFFLYRSWQDSRHRLLTLWEGLLSDTNYRDAGASLNLCLGETWFKAGVIGRANRKFSGWSCENIGSPDAMVSLNFRPDAPNSYYCRNSDGSILIGNHANTTFEFDDIERLDQWQDETFRLAICGTFDRIFAELSLGRKVLIHCDAGRDRTGTMIALLAQLTAESRGFNPTKTIAAAECDYRKSQTLVPAKYGRMAEFLASLGPNGATRLLTERCGFDAKKIASAVDHFSQD